MVNIELKVKKLKPHAILPSYAHPGDAGMDLYSAEDYSINPGERILVSTGIAVEVPFGYEMQIRPRSGLAIKNGITLLNTPGTLDAGYRGEIQVIMINHNNLVFNIKKGDRIAQAVINEVAYADIKEVQELSDTSRGTGGFGSTGIK